MDFQISNAKKLMLEADFRPVTVLWLNLNLENNQSSFRPAAAARLIMDFSQIAQKFGGVVRLRKDGLTAVFGISVVAENDVIQAVLAAHQIAQTCQAVLDNSIIPIQIAVSYDHVRIAHVPDGSGDQVRVSGDALEQAEALAATTPVPRIYVTSKVYRAAAHYFSFQPTVEQLVAEESFWELMGPLEQPGSARGLPGVRTRYIGRTRDLKSMFDLSENLNSGLGGIIWIEGEAGIGKSRMMREFETAVSLITTPSIWMGTCSANRTDYAFSLFSSLLANIFNIQTTDTSEQIKQKIGEGIKDWPRDARETQPYLELVMGLTPNDKQFERMQPEQMRQQTFVAMRRLLKTLGKERPLILFLDDLHWIDPISAELLLFIATIVASDPILFVCAQRLQGADSPNDRLVRLQSLLPGQTQQLFLEKLSANDSSKLLDELLLQAKLPEEFRALTVSRSEGNPYFIEEFVRMSIEQLYIQQENGAWKLRVPIEKLADMIPMSLSSLIHARVDALPEALRQVLQVAAIIGFEFNETLLQTITAVSAIQQTLHRLAQRLVISQTNTSQQWQFNHTLFHTIVYQSVPTEQRQKLHSQIALTLESQQIDGSVEDAAALAFHFSQAKEYTRAIPYLILAGEKAASQYANEEAVSHFQQAEKYQTNLPRPNTEWQWRIGIGLGEAYRITGLFEESIEALEKLIPLAKETSKYPYARLLILLGKTSRKLGHYDVGRNYLMQARDLLLSESTSGNDLILASQVLTELAWIYFAQGELEQARKLGTEGLEFAKEVDDLNEMANAENLLGGICYQSGNWQGAMHHTMRGMVFREQMEYSWAVARSYSNLGILAYVIGHWPKAIDYFQRSLLLRQEMGDVEGIAITHNNLGHPYRGQGKLELAETHYQESLQISELFGISDMVVNARSGLAQICLWQVRIVETEEHLSKALSLAQFIGAKEKLAELYRIRAELSLLKDFYQEALVEAEMASKMASEVGNKVSEASAWRIASKIALQMDDLDSAQVSLRKAQELFVGAMDELENGQLMVQSYRINLKLGNRTAAMADFAVAQSIFTRLGAMYHLEKLEGLRQEYTREEKG